jgi:hypothetical protein
MKYLVWSFEHSGWWGPGRMGYTPDLERAGRYSQEEAEAIARDANRYSQTPMEVAVPESDASSFPTRR